MGDQLLVVTQNGLYCPAGDFHVDPWKPVERAVVTHAHSDHACPGSGRYLTTPEGAGVLRARVGPSAIIDTLAHGDPVTHHGVRISLHPAGHVLGSAQVRLEHQGRVLVVSGDYKVEPDRTCRAFEPVRCHIFLTESTFGLPIYRWVKQSEIFSQINAWWRANQDSGKASLLLGYALGKSQRLLAGLDPSIGPIIAHGAVQAMCRPYREAGIDLPATTMVSEAPAKFDWSQAMIVAPPSAQGTPWTRRFGDHSTGLASGWMLIRGTRRRRSMDRGFALSDHADWPGLLDTIAATEAEEVWITHGYSAILARWLNEQGMNAKPLATKFVGDAGDQDLPVGEETPATSGSESTP